MRMYKLEYIIVVGSQQQEPQKGRPVPRIPRPDLWADARHLPSLTGFLSGSNTSTAVDFNP